MEQLQGYPSPPSPPLQTDSAAVLTPNRRQQQQFHAAARLQLAAALLEYDYEQDGKLAEHSAIFAPYRQEPDLSGVYSSSSAATPCPDYHGAGTDYVDHHHPQSTHSHGREDAQARYSIALSNAHFSGADAVISPSTEPRKSFDFLSPRSEYAGQVVGLPSDSALSPPSYHQAPLPVNDDTDDLQVDEAELASEWGLDNVVSKFEGLDSNAFRAEASKLQAAQAAAASSSKAGKGLKPKKGRKRSGTSGSDILLNLGGIHLDNALRLSGDKDAPQDAEEELDPTFGMDTHSAPTVLDLNLNQKQKKLRHRSGSLMKETRKSLESELEMAFSAAGSGGDLERGGGAASQYGGGGGNGARSRSSSFGGEFNNVFITPEVAKDEAVQAIADYAAEAVARPPSSLSMNGTSANYVSRFDPKAIAAQREEELSTRPRFPTALRPKILIMPAPLAELEAEEKARREAETQAVEGSAATTNEEKPRVEREAGKLYGRSLMDELQSRKERQKARNRAFRGDSRKAMMDMQKYKRAPSPLATTPGEGDLPRASQQGGDGDGRAEDSEDDDDKPLRPPTSGSPLGDDPWLKYTSHRSLANLAKGKSISNLNEGVSPKDGIKSSPSSPPALLSPDKRKSLIPALDTQRHTLSTAELQEQYKKNRQSMLDLNTYANEEEDGSDDEDDDIPLVTRQEQLTAAQQQQLQPSTPSPGLIADHPLQRTKLKEAQSVFGVDLVMQKELAKLEQILEIEEAERKIEAERQRVKDAEKEAKEAKKKAKAAKKEKKKALKEKAKAQAVGKEKSRENLQEQQHEQEVDLQWRTNNRASMVDNFDNSQDGHPGEWQDQDYQRKSYYSMHVRGEHDDFFGADNQRNSLMPEKPEEGANTPKPEEGANTPKPGRARSSSLAPSLTLPFLAGDAAVPGESDNSGTLGWFSDNKARKDPDSDDEAGSDREERVRAKSPFGIEGFASDDDEERVDDDAAAAIWAEEASKDKAKMREIAYDPSKKPELNRMSVAASFAGVLEGFGICGGEEGSDDDEDKENAIRSVHTRRLSVHEDKESDSEEAEDERRPLSTMLSGNSRRSQAFHSSGKPFTKVAFKAPRLDLPMDFAVAAKEDSDSEAEDDAPLALKRLNASLTAADQGRTYDSGDVQEEEDSEEDDLPLAVKQDDDKPLGQAHPVAALSQQMELQQQQNMALMSHLQLQYQYAMQMQMQQAIIQQADIQGYTASQLNYVPPSAALSGAASDIGANLGPDPKLVNSVDRWRQGVQH